MVEGGEDVASLGSLCDRLSASVHATSPFDPKVHYLVREEAVSDVTVTQNSRLDLKGRGYGRVVSGTSVRQSKGWENDPW